MSPSLKKDVAAMRTRLVCILSYDPVKKSIFGLPHRLPVIGEPGRYRANQGLLWENQRRSMMSRLPRTSRRLGLDRLDLVGMLVMPDSYQAGDPLRLHGAEWIADTSGVADPRLLAQAAKVPTDLPPFPQEEVMTAQPSSKALEFTNPRPGVIRAVVGNLFGDIVSLTTPALRARFGKGYLVLINGHPVGRATANTVQQRKRVERTLYGGAYDGSGSSIDWKKNEKGDHIGLLDGHKIVVYRLMSGKYRTTVEKGGDPFSNFQVGTYPTDTWAMSAGVRHVLAKRVEKLGWERDKFLAGEYDSLHAFKMADAGLPLEEDKRPAAIVEQFEQRVLTNLSPEAQAKHAEWVERMERETAEGDAAAQQEAAEPQEEAPQAEAKGPTLAEILANAPPRPVGIDPADQGYFHAKLTRTPTEDEMTAARADLEQKIAAQQAIPRHGQVEVTLSATGGHGPDVDAALDRAIAELRAVGLDVVAEAVYSGRRAL